jgi:hypothetical protein
MGSAPLRGRASFLFMARVFAGKKVIKISKLMHPAENLADRYDGD